jgi:hypothetical protein
MAIHQIGKSLYPMNLLSQQFNGIIKLQVILEVKDFTNTYVSDIIIEIYVNILVASIAIIAKGTN